MVLVFSLKVPSDTPLSSLSRLETIKEKIEDLVETTSKSKLLESLVINKLIFLAK